MVLSSSSSTNIREKLFPPGSGAIIITHQPTFERNYFNQAVVLSSSFINQHLREIISTRQRFHYNLSSTNIWEKLFPTRQRFYHYHSSTNIWEKLFPPGSCSIIIIHQPTFERNYFHQAAVLSLSFINQHLREIISTRQWFYHHHHQPTFERNYFHQAAVPSSSLINQHLREIISTRQWFYHHHSSTNIWEKLFQPGSGSIIIFHQPTFERNYFQPGSGSIIIIHQPTFERNYFHQAVVLSLSFINQHLWEIISTRQLFFHYHSSTNICEKLFPPGSCSFIIIHQPTFVRNYFNQAAAPSSSSFINQHLRIIISTREWVYHYHSSTNIWEKLFQPGSGSIIINHQPTFERNYFHQAEVLSLSFINQHLGKF